MRLAQQILAKRKTEVARHIHFPTLRFEQVRWSTLLDKWWTEHGQHTRSGFIYLLPRLRARFSTKRAREITPDEVQEFLDDLEQQELSASSINHYRTILNSVFNFSKKRALYDQNPIAAVRQYREPPGRDRFTTAEEVQALLAKCDEIDDIELKVFIIIAATTGMRKGEILSRSYKDVRLDDIIPHIYIARTKNGSSKRVALARFAINAIKMLPSYGKEEFLFPARPNVRFQGDFKKPHAWDFGKRFRRVCEHVGIFDLRIHDLRHFAATTLFIKGVPDTMIAKMTGHRSRELKRYQHLSETFLRNTAELIAGDLEGDSATDTPRKSRRASSPKSLKKVAEPTGLEPATSDVTGEKPDSVKSTLTSAINRLRRHRAT